MTFIRYQKGMSLKEFRRLMSEKPQGKRNNDCGCDCDGCANPGAGTHCLKPPCTRTRNRRSPAVLAAGGRRVPTRVKVSAKRKPAVKKTVAEPVEKMRAEWFVDCKRNATELSMPAPEGEEQANRIRDIMIGHGWEAKAVLRDTFRDDERFHQLPKDGVAHGKA